MNLVKGIMMELKNYWSETVKNLKPYIPGEQPKINNLIKLNTNENPFPPTPLIDNILKNYSAKELRLYPDPESTELKKAIADYYQLMPEQIFVGNGSDEVLAHIFPALLNHNRPILFPDITYSFYPVYCQLFNIEFKTIALDSEFKINPDDYKIENGGIIFPNPNAPTGIYLPLQAIEIIAKNNPNSMIIVDEAYIDFGGESAISLIQNYPNILIVQTFSKSRSLAGLRIGFAIGHPEIIQALVRVKNSFNSYPLDKIAQISAIAALKDEDYFQITRQQIIQNREYLIQQLIQNNFMVLPSLANFIFVQHQYKHAEKLMKLLREHSIIVRHFNLPRIENFLRITIGTKEECEQLIKTLETVLNA